MDVNIYKIWTCCGFMRLRIYVKGCDKISERNIVRVKEKVVKLWQMEKRSEDWHIFWPETSLEFGCPLCYLCCSQRVTSMYLNDESMIMMIMQKISSRFMCCGNNEGYSKYCSHHLVIRIDLKSLNFALDLFCFWTPWRTFKLWGTSYVLPLA